MRYRRTPKRFGRAQEAPQKPKAAPGRDPRSRPRGRGCPGGAFVRGHAAVQAASPVYQQDETRGQKGPSVRARFNRSASRPASGFEDGQPSAHQDGPFAVTGGAAKVPAQKVLSSTASRLQKGARARSALLRAHAAALNFGSSSVRRQLGRCGSLPESIGQSSRAWHPAWRSPGPRCALRLDLD